MRRRLFRMLLRIHGIWCQWQRIRWGDENRCTKTKQMQMYHHIIPRYRAHIFASTMVTRHLIKHPNTTFFHALVEWRIGIDQLSTRTLAEVNNNQNEYDNTYFPHFCSCASCGFFGDSRSVCLSVYMTEHKYLVYFQRKQNASMA